MLRTLLATTALAALGTSGALAQVEQQDDPQIQAQANQQAAQTGQGQEVFVNSGDTVVIQSDQSGAFTLNFQFAQQDGAAGQAPMGAMGQGPAATGAWEDLQPGDPERLSTETLMGADVYGANQDNIGNVNDVLLSEDGEVDAMIVDVGGFLGIGAHQVAIGLDNLEFMEDNNQNWFVFTPFTQQELEAQPQYDEQTYLQQRDDQRMTSQQPMQQPAQ